MLPMPLKSRIFSFKNKIIYWRFFVLLAGRRMVRTLSGHHRYKTANLYKITERIPKKMRRFFRGGCKCLNAKMESQNYLLSFCAGVQEGLLQAYHEQCRSTVIVKTRPTAVLHRNRCIFPDMEGTCRLCVLSFRLLLSDKARQGCGLYIPALAESYTAALRLRA